MRSPAPAGLPCSSLDPMIHSENYCLMPITAWPAVSVSGAREVSRCALRTARPQTSNVARYVADEKPAAMGSSATAAQIQTVDRNLPALSQTSAGTSNGRSYAYALGAQNNDSANASDKSGTVERERNLHRSRIAAKMRTAVKGKLPVPSSSPCYPASSPV